MSEGGAALVAAIKRAQGIARAGFPAGRRRRPALQPARADQHRNGGGAMSPPNAVPRQKSTRRSSRQSSLAPVVEHCGPNVVAPTFLIYRKRPALAEVWHRTEFGVMSVARPVLDRPVPGRSPSPHRSSRTGSKMGRWGRRTRAQPVTLCARSTTPAHSKSKAKIQQIIVRANAQRDADLTGGNVACAWRATPR